MSLGLISKGDLAQRAVSCMYPFLEDLRLIRKDKRTVLIRREGIFRMRDRHHRMSS